MDWSGFHGTYGCLWALGKVALLIYAILAVALGEATFYEWVTLIGAVMLVMISVLYHRATKRDYNRKDSYWSKKEEPDDPSKE